MNLHDAVLLYGYGLKKALEAGTENCAVRKKDIVDLQFKGINYNLMTFLVLTYGRILWTSPSHILTILSGRINDINIDAKGDVLNPDTLVYNFQITDGIAELAEVGEVRMNKYTQVLEKWETLVRNCKLNF